MKIEDRSRATIDKTFFEHKGTKTQRHEFTTAEGKYHEVIIAEVIIAEG